MTPLERVKTRLGIKLDDTSRDEEIELRIWDAEDFFRNYCRRTEIPPRAAGLIERLAVLFEPGWDRVQAERIGDTSTTFRAEGLPTELQTELNRFRRVVAL